MALQLVRSSSQLIYTSNPPITGIPLTIAFWEYRDPLTANTTPVGFSSSTDSNHLIGFYQASSTLLRMYLETNGSGFVVVSPNPVNASPLATWTHICGRFVSGSHAVWLNGGNKGTSSTVISSPTNINRFSIGGWFNTGPTHYYDGKLAEVAVWNIGLDDAEVLSLSKGVSPLTIRPNNLVIYAPLIGQPTEIDLVSGITFTHNNSPTKADHPRIFYPARPLGMPLPAPVGGAPQTVDADTIATGESVPSPAVNLTIRPDTIGSGEALFLPTVTPGTATVLPNSVPTSEAFFNPILVAGLVTVLPDTIPTNEQLYQPTIALVTTVLPDNIPTSEALFDPTIVVGVVVVLPDEVPTSEALYEPVIGQFSQIIADTIPTSELVFDPVVNAVITLLPDDVTTGEALFDPQLNLRQYPDTVPTSEVVFDPVVVPGTVTLLPAHIPSSSTVLDPVITFAQVMEPDTVTTSEALYAPSLTLTIFPGTVTTDEAVFDPTTIVGNTNVLPGTVPTSEVVYEPRLIYPSGKVIRVVGQSAVLRRPPPGVSKGRGF